MGTCEPNLDKYLYFIFLLQVSTTWSWISSPLPAYLSKPRIFLMGLYPWPHIKWYLQHQAFMSIISNCLEEKCILHSSLLILYAYGFILIQWYLCKKTRTIEIDSNIQWKPLPKHFFLNPYFLFKAQFLSRTHGSFIKKWVTMKKWVAAFTLNVDLSVSEGSSQESFRGISAETHSSCSQ